MRICRNSRAGLKPRTTPDSDQARQAAGLKPRATRDSDPHRDAWIRDHASAALAGVEKEALRRIRRNKGKQPIPEMHILESGLWSALPQDAWDLELRLSEKQGAEFRLQAPDEEGARAAYEAAHPERVEARATFLADLVPPPDLLTAHEEDDGESDGSGNLSADDDQADQESDHVEEA